MRCDIPRKELLMMLKDIMLTAVDDHVQQIEMQGSHLPILMFQRCNVEFGPVYMILT